MYLIGILLILIGDLFGIGLSNSMGMFYNFIIMPIIGGLLKFKSYSVVIQEPKSEDKDKPQAQGESLHLLDFPVEKIESENLIDVIKDHQAQWEAEHEK